MFSVHIVRQTLMTQSVLGLVLLAGTGHFAWAAHQSGHRGRQANTEIGLDGYCPVCIVAARKWEKGSPEHQVTYDGVTYYFPNPSIKAKFEVNPAQYVPALGGDCTVCYAKLGKRVAGSVQHAALYQQRLFLFPGPQEKAAFLKNPAELQDVDLALGGQCAVCLVAANKSVPGKAEFTEVHNGFRYQFPSAQEQAAFRQDPQRYAQAAAAANTQTSTRRSTPKNSLIRQVSSEPAPKATGKTFTATGRSGCAGCEHGVLPTQDPNELGLAVNTPDGRVVIVEKAHKLYPKVYQARFGGQKIQVSGQVIKTQGKFTWIEPTGLKVLN